MWTANVRKTFKHIHIYFFLCCLSTEKGLQAMIRHYNSILDNQTVLEELFPTKENDRFRSGVGKEGSAGHLILPDRNKTM